MSRRTSGSSAELRSSRGLNTKKAGALLAVDFAQAGQVKSLYELGWVSKTVDLVRRLSNLSWVTINEWGDCP